MKKDKNEYLVEKLRVQAILMRHVGQSRAIGMGELYREVFGEGWENRINDTRRLRTVITMLRDEGNPICSVSSVEGGGYYIAAAGAELEDYLTRGKRRALSMLGRNARIMRMNLAEYLGQMKLALEGAHEEQN